MWISAPSYFRKMLPYAVTVAVVLHLPGDETRLLMSYEYRYPVGRYLLSPVAGLLDQEDREGPDPLVSAAIREGGVQHMYRIFLRGRRDAELAVDIDGLAALGNVTEVDDETLPEYDAEALMREHADDLIGQFVASLYEEAGQDSVAEKALCYGLAALKV